MIALLYGVVRRGVLPSNVTGVLGAPINTIENGDLALLHSPFAQQPELAMPQSAVEFHGVLQAVLKAHEIVPFRFPTWLAKEELASHLELEAAVYRSTLDKIAGCVQMEVHLTPVKELSQSQQSARSGREYLQSKAVAQNELRNAVRQVRENLGELGLVREWRLRSMPNGSTRMFALVPRAEAETFARSAAPISVGNASMRVTGPWAATEFIEVKERTKA